MTSFHVLYFNLSFAWKLQELNRQTTVKPSLTATSVIRSPCYYGYFFWPPGKNRHTFSCKKTSLIQPIFWGPLVTVLTGFHCNRKRISQPENSRGNKTTHAILLKEENKWLWGLTNILTLGRLKGILITLYCSLTNN